MRFILRSVFQLVISFFLGFSALQAQQSVYQVGEIGLGVGAGHYFGDLVSTATYDRPKIAATAFYRKKLNDLIAARVGLSFAQLGYSDTYNAKTKGRNLSFNSAVWELTLQGDLDLSRFIPGLAQYNIMPYFTVGAGVFSYDPYTYLQGEKIFLRPLGTEGQGSVLYPDRKTYSSTALCAPVGFGIKYALSDRMNISFEVLQRFTNTDYLDDVSKTYVDPAVFPPNADGSPSIGYLLSDRSYELGPRVGTPGGARGNSAQKDGFITAMLHLSFNLQTYRCPTAN